MRNKSPDQVKKDFEKKGETITDWALAHGFDRHDVYKVLNGQAKCKRGKGHEIAVALGLKQGTSQMTNA
ncbi:MULTISPECIES: DNA-binding protein [Acinetobacter calcoaceticus/baumannii complex]|uniref:DNA-binding protein n=1 Tax=Acinetobacter calcoaceticus/baumannii complex TaxID=909768 RepID=UPI0001F8AE00|nr:MULTISPECIES: DNA-binding protein [Acinetobacter calcoaceticus/baumannii complex]ADX03004.1 putative transcriptional regulator [Acinetobacter baumannii 1656-2]AOP63354.1 BcepMu gp16 family phage-associated protein [Acinetobacter baumannii DU202]QEA26374.1 DNA-binding protein [Acinetobacter pittii]RQL52005.1 transcriptional regulator [Acinetobacter baumannii]RSP41882.1 DNA-binding protein [Acinetobacter baumannii]